MSDWALVKPLQNTCLSPHPRPIIKIFDPRGLPLTRQRCSRRSLLRCQCFFDPGGRWRPSSATASTRSTDDRVQLLRPCSHRIDDSCVRQLQPPDRRRPRPATTTTGSTATASDNGDNQIDDDHVGTVRRRWCEPARFLFFSWHMFYFVKAFANLANFPHDPIILSVWLVVRTAHGNCAPCAIGNLIACLASFSRVRLWNLYYCKCLMVKINVMTTWLYMAICISLCNVFIFLEIKLSHLIMSLYF